ncbi:MAG: M48 family metallopeptidase [Pseudomonadota bacterium]
MKITLFRAVPTVWAKDGAALVGLFGRRSREARESAVVQGFHFELGQVGVTPAVIALERGIVVVRAADDGRILSKTLRREAHISRRNSAGASQIALPGQWSFETADRGGFERLLTDPVDRLIPWLAGGWHRVVVAVVIVVALLAAGWRFGIPAATNLAVRATPYAVEEGIGQGTLAQLDVAFFQPSKVPDWYQQQLRINFSILVRTYMQREDARTEAKFTLLFRDAPQLGPNALALPDGTIILTDDFVELFEDDGPIVPVLAHEIGHVHAQDSLFQIYRSLGLGVLVDILAGDQSDLTEAAVAQGATLSGLALSRRMERDADIFAVKLSVEAGFDPEGLITALEALSEDCPECAQASWIATHPGLEERRKAIRKAIAEQPAPAPRREIVPPHGFEAPGR